MQFRARTAILAMSMVACNVCAADDKSPAQMKSVNSPSRAETLKFIQDKLNLQGDFFYTQTAEVMDHSTRETTKISDVIVDNSSCLMHWNEYYKTEFQPKNGESTVSIGNFTYSGNDLTWERVDYWELSLRDVKRIQVQSLEDQLNKMSEENHSTVHTLVAPHVMRLDMRSDGHNVFKFGSRHRKGSDQWQQENYVVQDVYMMIGYEEMAARIANALVHAVELCGGQNEAF